MRKMNFNNLKNFLDYMAENRTVGNAVEVYKDGKSVFRYACGYSDLERKIPLSGDEFFNIYSCSKIATCAAGIQLLEQGKFLLSDPLSEYIPEFKEMLVKDEKGNLSKAGKPITIGDLFSMTAGFAYDLNSEGFQRARELTNGKMDTVDVIRCVAKDPLSFEPGSRWQYSICHDVLAALISVISGKKFRDYVRENIFEPLDMTQSSYHQTKESLEKMAKQYCFVEYEGQEIEAVEAQKSGTAKQGIFQDVGLTNSFILGDEYGWGGAAGSTAIIDTSVNLAVFYVQHTLNPREAFYQPRLKNVVYSCLS